MKRDDPALTRLTASRRRFNRLFVALFLATSHIAFAQGAAVVRHIGRLEPGTPQTPEETWKGAEALRELGWVEGQNLHVERRYANNRIQSMQTLAEELVRAKV